MFSKNYTQGMGSETIESPCNQNSKQCHMNIIPMNDDEENEERRKKEVEKEDEFVENRERKQEAMIEEEEMEKRDDEKRNEIQEKKDENERQRREEEERRRREARKDEERTEREDRKQEKAKLEADYHWIYRYETHQIKLRYNQSTKTWHHVHVNHHPEEEKQLNAILTNLQNGRDLTDCTLNEQIQIIKNKFDRYFLEVNQTEETERSKKKTSISSTVLEKQDKIKSADNERNGSSLNQTLTRLTIPEDSEQQKDHVDYESRSKFSGLAPPPVAPRRSRQNSACSTQSSVRYASFIPPPVAPVRRRRVIASILLHVQKKKKTFENIVDTLRGIQRPTMHELGSEFLHIYDGRFNYPVGHTFVMSFRKKSWYLTIDQINCVDCPVGEIGPRSVLMLNYKGQYSTIHV